MASGDDRLGKEDLAGLDHSVLMDKVKNDWQDRNYVLKWFRKKEGEAKRNDRQMSGFWAAGNLWQRKCEHESIEITKPFSPCVAGGLAMELFRPRS